MMGDTSYRKVKQTVPVTAKGKSIQYFVVGVYILDMNTSTVLRFSKTDDGKNTVNNDFKNMKRHIRNI